ncbi:MAG: PEP-CTERM sorting domain-containing protein [Pseudomonadota bacterium]
MLKTLPLAISLTLAPALASANIDIVFDYTYDTTNFFGTTQKSILESAANVFESRITDQLGAITSAGSNTLDLSFYNPSTGAQTDINNASIAANELRIYVGAMSLGGSTLGKGGPGGGSISYSSLSFFDSLSRGQTGYVPFGPAGVYDTDFAPWGGTLSLNSSYSNWYFDSDVSTMESFSGADFYSVALHEIGHVLGYGTSNSWKNKVNAAVPSFTGAYSGTQPLDDDAHWQDGLTSTINGAGSFEAAMDPTIFLGTRKEFTDLDWNGLRDIGWQVAAAPVPEPETWALLLAGLTLVSVGAKRRRA